MAGISITGTVVFFSISLGFLLLFLGIMYPRIPRLSTGIGMAISFCMLVLTALNAFVAATTPLSVIWMLVFAVTTFVLIRSFLRSMRCERNEVESQQLPLSAFLLENTHLAILFFVIAFLMPLGEAFQSKILLQSPPRPASYVEAIVLILARATGLSFIGLVVGLLASFIFVSKRSRRFNIFALIFFLVNFSRVLRNVNLT